MSKMPLAWHKECLSNTYKSLERKKEQLANLEKEVAKDLQKATFYHVQLREAERQGKDGFDSDLFMKKERHHYIKTNTQ